MPKPITFSSVDYMIISLMISQTLSLSYFPTLVLCFHLGYNQWDFFVGSWSPPQKKKAFPLVVCIQYQYFLSNDGACSEVMFAFE